MEEDAKAYAATMHEVLYDGSHDHVESFLSVHQSLCDRQNGIDGRARTEHDIHGNSSLQSARFGVTMIPFYFVVPNASLLFNQ
jgi:hypothetical protein